MNDIINNKRMYEEYRNQLSNKRIYRIIVKQVVYSFEFKIFAIS